MNACRFVEIRCKNRGVNKAGEKELKSRMEVFIDDVASGKRLMVSTEKEKTVLELKEALKKQEDMKVPTEQLVLLFSHHHKRHDKLNDSARLSAYGIDSGSLLKLVVGTSSSERYRANFGRS